MSIFWFNSWKFSASLCLVWIFSILYHTVLIQKVAYSEWEKAKDLKDGGRCGQRSMLIKMGAHQRGSQQESNWFSKVEDAKSAVVELRVCRVREKRDSEGDLRNHEVWKIGRFLIWRTRWIEQHERHPKKWNDEAIIIKCCNQSSGKATQTLFFKLTYLNTSSFCAK